jgi:hypothetical protein
MHETHPRPARTARGLRRHAACLLALAGCARATADGAPFVVADADGARTLAGCPSLPPDSAFNVPVTALPAHAESVERIGWLSENAGGDLLAGACSYVWEGSRCGLPITAAGAGVEPRLVRFAGPYVWGNDHFSIPEEYRIEGEPNPAGAWDRHVLVVDAERCELHELINVRASALGLYADGAAKWDLFSTGYAVESWAGAEAAGLPMVPLIYSYEEVAAGVIPHALRVVLPVSAAGFLWPANHTDGASDDPRALPMGAWLRLRADTDLSGLGPQATVIATALQTYGAIVADTTVAAWHLSGTPDTRWDDADLETLGTLTPSDFEWLDVTARAGDGGSLAAADAAAR